MSQPVKLSDSLVLEARLAAQASERSIAGQVEFWAKLGRSLEELLGGKVIRSFREKARYASLTELVGTVETPEGRARLQTYLESEPFPHFEPHPERKGILLRIEADGSRTAGRFVDRQFVPVEPGKKRPTGARTVASSPGRNRRAKAAKQ